MIFDLCKWKKDNFFANISSKNRLRRRKPLVCTMKAGFAKKTFATNNVPLGAASRLPLVLWSFHQNWMKKRQCLLQIVYHKIDSVVENHWFAPWRQDLRRKRLLPIMFPLVSLVDWHSPEIDRLSFGQVIQWTTEQRTDGVCFHTKQCCRIFNINTFLLLYVSIYENNFSLMRILLVRDIFDELSHILARFVSRRMSVSSLSVPRSSRMILAKMK